MCKVLDFRIAGFTHTGLLILMGMKFLSAPVSNRIETKGSSRKDLPVIVSKSFPASPDPITKARALLPFPPLLLLFPLSLLLLCYRYGSSLGNPFCSDPLVHTRSIP